MNYSNLKTAVIGITKNNGDCISRGIKNMMKISELFKDSIVYIYENDSTDEIINKIAFSIEQHETFLKVIPQDELSKHNELNKKREF